MSDSNRKAREWWLNVAPKQKAFGHTTRKAALLAKSFPSVEVVHVLEATPLTKAAGQLLEALKGMLGAYLHAAENDDAAIAINWREEAIEKAKLAIAQAERGGE